MKTDKKTKQISKPIWNKGKKMPHSKEWEEKRLKAIRDNAWKLKGRKNPSGKETIKYALLKYKEAKLKNPEKYKLIAINNLPKDRSGKNNGRWKGGITAKTRGIRFSKEYVYWRKSVLERDHYECVDCNSKKNLAAHHIIPLSVLPSAHLIRANGVTLCNECHKKTNSYSNGKEKINIKSKCGNLFIIMKIIPHNWQDYNTIGNYFTTSDNVSVILVSDLGNDDYNFLVFIHEMIEQRLCKKKGITEEEIDRFDMEHPEFFDPGSDENAPYKDQHQIATDVEANLSEKLEVLWFDYEHIQNKLVRKWNKDKRHNI